MMIPRYVIIARKSILNLSILSFFNYILMHDNYPCYLMFENVTKMLSKFNPTVKKLKIKKITTF